MFVSVVLLIVVAFSAVVLLFLGNLDGRVPRVVLTLVAFAGFTILTAVDSRPAAAARRFYVPLALLTNVYILALSLMITWVRAGRSGDLWILFFWVVFGGVVLTFVVCRAALAIGDGLLRFQRLGNRLLNGMSLLTAVLLGATALLFTAWLAVWALGHHVGDLYWKIAVSALIIAALGIAVTVLLYWTYSAPERAVRAEAKTRAQAHPAPSGVPGQAAGGYPPPTAAPMPVGPGQPIPPDFAPAPAGSYGPPAPYGQPSAAPYHQSTATAYGPPVPPAYGQTAPGEYGPSGAPSSPYAPGRPAGQPQQPT